MNTCENGDHNRVVLDRFSKLPGVQRSVPGDCYCMDCKKPLPAWWNGGRPEAIAATE